MHIKASFVFLKIILFYKMSSIVYIMISLLDIIASGKWVRILRSTSGCNSFREAKWGVQGFWDRGVAVYLKCLEAAENGEGVNCFFR